MILIQQLKIKIPHAEGTIKERAAKALLIRTEDILSLEILRRSLDARKKPELFYIYSVEVKVKNENKVLEKALRNKKAKEQFSISDREKYLFPNENMRLKVGQCIDKEKRTAPVVIGAGPAGLFCGYYLAKAGLNPLILERGKAVEDRQRDVESFWKTGVLNPSSNVQFGEGGAGTFSDGKLNTLVKDKQGRNRAVLDVFVEFGADSKIVYDAKPHIGTDVLANVVRNLRNEIIRLGGIVRFETKVTDLLIENNRLTGLVINNTERISCSEVVLAIGHSARDTFYMLADKKLKMEAKSFAVGFRVEHPQSMINFSQYGMEDCGELGAAAYKVTAKTKSGRGVYSFCMCPGGYVVNASSEEGRLAVNGMSYSGRNGRNANSAVIVSVGPEDYPGDDALAGIEFQRQLEEKAYRLAEGKIPVQLYGDFKRGADKPFAAGKNSASMLPSCKGMYAWADLRGLLPQECETAFVEGMQQFARQIKDFDRDDVILSGVESRTSSPVRIVRNEFCEADVHGIYPCGEGAGYAGGITSAAMDGLRVAENIVNAILKKRGFDE